MRRGTAAELEEAIAAIEPPLASEVASEVASEAASAVASGVAPSPERARTLRGDLDAILNQALKKHPADRYPSVDAFVQDIERWFADQPVRARPDSIAYRARRFARRHRVQIAAGGAVALALVAGSGIALQQALEARSQAQRAGTEARTAKAVQAFMEGVFRANSGDQSDPRKARETTARQLLDLGAQRIGRELDDAPEARLTLLKTIADMYQDMALHDDAARMLRQRVDLARATHGARAATTAQALAELAFVLGWTDKRDEAFAAVREAAAMLDALGDRESQARFDVDYALAFLSMRVDLEAALAAADRAVANARRRPPSPELVKALVVQAESSLYLGRHGKTRDAAQEAIRWIKEQPALGAGMLSTLTIALGEAQIALGELDAGEASLRKAVDVARTQNDAAPIYAHAAARVLATFLRRHGRLRESLDASEPTYAWARGARGSFGHMPATLSAEHAQVLMDYGRVDEALAVLDEADRLLADMPAVEVSNRIRLVRVQGWIEQGRYDEAQTELGRAEEFYAGAKLGASPLVQLMQRRLRVATGAADAALRDWQRQRNERGLPALPSADETPRERCDAALLLLQAGHVDAALDQARSALAAVEANPYPHQLVDVQAQALRIAGFALMLRGELDAALAAMTRSLGLLRQVFDSERSLAFADALAELSRVQRRLGRADESARLLAQARGIHAQHARVGRHHVAALEEH